MSSRYVFKYAPVKPIAIAVLLLALLSIGIVLAIMYVWPLAITLVFLVGMVIAKLTATAAWIRISIEDGVLDYRYRSFGTSMHRRIDPRDISDLSTEVVTMHGGEAVRSLVLEAEDEKLVLVPFYSTAGPKEAELIDRIDELRPVAPRAEDEEIEAAEEAPEEQRERPVGTVWGLFEMSIDCPRCDAPVLIDGPYRRFVCSRCQSKIDFTEDVWIDTLEDVRDELMYEIEPGRGTNSTIMGTFDMRMLYGRQIPYCMECKRDYDMESEYTGGDRLVCPQCGTETPVYSAPDWFERVIAGAELIVGAYPEGDPTDLSLPESGEPMALDCPGCGASLQVKTKERMQACGHCGLTVYLPSELWHKLCPPRKKNRWFVGFDASVDEQGDDE